MKRLALSLRMAGLLASAVMSVAGCTPFAPLVERREGPLQEPDRPASLVKMFEQQQRGAAVDLVRRQRLADAAVVWEVLVVLRPDVVEYREQLADTRRRIDAVVTELLPRAALAARRGDPDAAARQYLAVLALQPYNRLAADALRVLERERNSRLFLGRPARVTLARRAVGLGARMSVDDGAAVSNEVEHAALLARQDESDEAVALLERRLAEAPSDAGARRLLADLYNRRADVLATRDRPAAVAALQRSLSLEPAQPQAALRLQQLREAIRQQPPPAASAATSD